MNVMIHPVLPLILFTDGEFIRLRKNRWGYTSIRNKEKGTWDGRYFTIEIDRKKYYVHNLMTEVFLGERPNGFVVDHIDRDTTNNRIDNLRLVSRQDNLKNSKPGDNIDWSISRKERKRLYAHNRYLRRKHNA